LGQERVRRMWTTTQKRIGLPLLQHGYVNTAPWATAGTSQVSKWERADDD